MLGGFPTPRRRRHTNDPLEPASPEPASDSGERPVPLLLVVHRAPTKLDAKESNASDDQLNTVYRVRG